MRHGATGLAVAAAPLGLAKAGAHLLRGSQTTVSNLPTKEQREATAAARAEARKAEAERKKAESARAEAERNAALAQLVAPIAVGARLSGLRVASLAVDQRDRGVITLVDRQGREWHAEVASRTAEDVALNPLELTSNYSLYVRNGGTGRTPTSESVAHAVRALANRVRSNEHTTASPRLTSRTRLWASTRTEAAGTNA